MISNGTIYTNTMLLESQHFDAYTFDIMYCDVSHSLKYLKRVAILHTLTTIGVSSKFNSDGLETFL